MSNPPLHRYQRKAVDFIKSKKNVFLLFDMGLGKSRCVLEYLKESKEKAFICAPLLATEYTWPEQIQLWTPELTFGSLRSKNIQSVLDNNLDIYLLNYDSLIRLTRCISDVLKDRVLVLDESAYVKNRSSKRSKFLIANREYFKQCLCLSALPAPNGVHELWSQYRILDKGERLGKKWKTFESLFTVGRYKELYPNPGAVDFISNKIKDCTLALSAEDYLTLPPLIHNDISIKLPKDLMFKYTKLQNAFFLELNEVKKITAVNSAILSSKLRQFIQGGLYDENGLFHLLHKEKINAATELIQNVQEQILLVFSFRFEEEIIRDKFPEVKIISGTTKLQNKLQYLEQWNSKKLPLLAVNSSSLNDSLNLQEGGRYILWLSLTWSLSDYKQLIGRIWRQGQTKPVVIYHILAEDTIDTKIVRVLKNKNSMQQDIINILKH